MIPRGTTPTLQFNLPFMVEELDAIYITFTQNATVVFEKTISDCVLASNTISVHLSQAETLLLNEVFPIEIQIRTKKGDEAQASSVITAEVGRILKDGQI